MQGVVFIVPAADAQGLIVGDDGGHYSYTLAGWRNPNVSPAPGLRVDFEVTGSLAHGIYPLLASSPPPQAPPTGPVASPYPSPAPSPAGPGSAAPFTAPARPVSAQRAVGEMNLLELYFNPSGRINRSTFWLKGVLLLRLIWFVVYLLEVFLVVRMIFDLDPLRIYESLQYDPVRTLELLAERFVMVILIHTVLSLVDLWTSFSVVVKRLHDLSRSAWWILGWAALWLLGALTVGFIIGIFIWLAVAIWIFVWLGCMEGTRGQNRYGEATT